MNPDVDSKYDSINFITNNSLQTSLFKENLQNNCTLNIEKHRFSAFLEIMKKDNKKNYLVIIDLDYFEDEFMTQYLQVIINCKVNIHELLINVDPELELESIVRFPRVRGVFYRDDKLDIINLGIKHLLKGDFWFSRGLSYRLIEFYRGQDVYLPKVATTLTNREEQVLKLLLLGASNQQIANDLFVSENTVKTHLHNVFKKIKVKNRLQALMWAKHQHFVGEADA